MSHQYHSKLAIPIRTLINTRIPQKYNSPLNRSNRFAGSWRGQSLTFERESLIRAPMDHPAMFPFSLIDNSIGQQIFVCLLIVNGTHLRFDYAPSLCGEIGLWDYAPIPVEWSRLNGLID